MIRAVALVLGGAALAAGLGFAVRKLAAIAPATQDVPSVAAQAGPFRRVARAEGYLRPVTTTVLSAPRRGFQLLVSYLAEDGAPVRKGDVVVRFDASDLRENLVENRSTSATTQSRIEREKTSSATAVSERERSAVLSKQELEGTQQLGKKDPRYFPRAEVIESEIDEDLYKTRLEHANGARSVEATLATRKLDLLATEMRRATLRAKQAEDALAAMVMRAPHDGTFFLERHDSYERRGDPIRIGDRVWPGMRIAQIGTSNDLEAEVFVLEADAGGLAPGKPATLILESQPDRPLGARILRVDAFPKRRVPDVPTQYFTTVLAIDGSTAGLKPGLRARVDIVLDDLPRALTVPRQAVFRRDETTIVYRRAGERFEPVEVILGAGTPGRVVVEKGIAAGDVLALRDPTGAASRPSGAGSTGSAAAPSAAPAGAPRDRGGRP